MDSIIQNIEDVVQDILKKQIRECTQKIVYEIVNQTELIDDKLQKNLSTLEQRLSEIEKKLPPLKGAVELQNSTKSIQENGLKNESIFLSKKRKAPLPSEFIGHKRFPALPSPSLKKKGSLLQYEYSSKASLNTAALASAYLGVIESKTATQPNIILKTDNTEVISNESKIKKEGSADGSSFIGGTHSNSVEKSKTASKSSLDAETSKGMEKSTENNNGHEGIVKTEHECEESETNTDKTSASAKVPKLSFDIKRVVPAPVHSTATHNRGVHTCIIDGKTYSKTPDRCGKFRCRVRFLKQRRSLGSFYTIEDSVVGLLLFNKYHDYYVQKYGTGEESYVILKDLILRKIFKKDHTIDYTPIAEIEPKAVFKVKNEDITTASSQLSDSTKDAKPVATSALIKDDTLNQATLQEMFTDNVATAEVTSVTEEASESDNVLENEIITVNETRTSDDTIDNKVELTSASSRQVHEQSSDTKTVEVVDLHTSLVSGLERPEEENQ